MEKEFEVVTINSKGKILTSSDEVLFDSEDFKTLSNKIDEVNDSLRYEEYETICGTWCGEVLYRKIVRIGSLPDTTIKNIPHGLKNITVVKTYGFIGNGTGVSLTLPLSDIRLVGNVKLYADGTNITIETGMDRTSFNGTAIIEYVKNKV